MAYDIFGNNLRRGYCEVHPHVAEEYTCCMCMMESKQINNQRMYEQQDTRTMPEFEEMKCCGNCKCYRKLKVSVYECTLADGDQPCNPIESGDHVCIFWEFKSK